MQVGFIGSGNMASATSQEALRAAHPGTPVFRLEPDTPVVDA